MLTTQFQKKNVKQKIIKMAAKWDMLNMHLYVMLMYMNLSSNVQRGGRSTITHMLQLHFRLDSTPLPTTSELIWSTTIFFNQIY